MVAALQANIRVVSLPLMTSWLHRALYKLTLAFPKLDPEQRVHSFMLRRLHHQHRFNAVNPHLHAAATMVCTAFDQVQIPIIESDHGDYGLLAQQPDLSSALSKLARLDAIVCPSQANADHLRALPWPRLPKLSVIPYAMPQGAGSTEREASFTFGMIARGIAEKGWAEAIAAFGLLRERVSAPMKLLLVGDGTEIARLRSDCAADASIEFAGHQSDSAAWIARFDVGLLPSYFAAESLPCAVIECLAQGKPVIATRIGGLPEMIEPSTGACGKLVPLATNGRADVQALANAMESMLNDADRETLSAQARIAFEAYSPSRVARSYADAVLALRSVKPASALSSIILCA
jgi:L-malate glycosyltransferase